jgi:HK97 family phage major capsid protein
MDWKEMLARADQLFAQVKAILSDAVPEDGAEGGARPATAEEKEHVQGMMEEARGLKARALTLQEVEDEGREVASARRSAEAKAVKMAEEQNQETTEPEAKSAEGWSWGDYLTAVWLARAEGYRDKRLEYFKDENPRIERKDMTEGVGAAGGFLVPVEFQAQLQAAMMEDTSIRARCTRIPMRRRQVTIPVLDQTATTSGIPHWFGGLRFYWQEEATEKTESDAEFRQVNLVAHKLIGLNVQPLRRATGVANPEYRWKPETVTPRHSPRGKAVTTTKGQLSELMA